MREFDQHGQPLCPACKVATNAVYATVPSLPCWQCGAMLPEPNLSNRTQKPPRHGDGSPFIACGQTWYLEPLTPGIRKRFAQWCKLMALQEILEDKNVIDEETYRERLSVHEEQAASGVYRWGTPFDPKRAGRGVARMLGNEEGLIYLTRLLLEREHGDVEPTKIAELMDDNPDGYKIAYRGSMQLDPLDRRPRPLKTETRAEAGEGTSNEPENT